MNLAKSLFHFIWRLISRGFRPLPVDVRVFTQQERSLSEVQHAAIAIKSIDSKQRHIGVLHTEDGLSDAFLLHLAWHHDLRNDHPNDSYHWVDPPVHKRRLRQVAARCRQVWRANPDGIPYAFSTPNDCFDDDTKEFLLGPSRYGLTCASFVFAVFESAGLTLANYQSWPTNRPGDREWQERVVELLKNNHPPASDDHIEKVQKEIGSVRFRPEDVAGAATCSLLPAEFEAATKGASVILSRLVEP